jgi:hypothetical protein
VSATTRNEPRGRTPNRIVGKPDERTRNVSCGRYSSLLFAGGNGPSAEGSVTGTLNNVMTQNGLPDTVEAQLPRIDEIGGLLHENHYPVGSAAERPRKNRTKR